MNDSDSHIMYDCCFTNKCKEMIIHISEDKSPPWPYLKLILMHCPDSAMLYSTLWNLKDDQEKIEIHREDIPKTFLIDTKSFNARLRKICKEQLLSYEIENGLYEIELIGWGDDTD